MCKPSPLASRCLIIGAIFGLGTPQIVFPGERTSLTSNCRTSRGLDGHCRTLSDCATLIGDEVIAETSVCTQEGGASGICCADLELSTQAFPVASTEILRISVPEVAISFSLPDTVFEESGQVGVNEVQGQRTVEEELLRRNVQVQFNTPSFGHLQFFQTSINAMDLADRALAVIGATRRIQQLFNLSPAEGGFGLNIFSVENTNVLRQACPAVPPCAQSKYRTPDGSCNNLQNSLWGKSFTAFQRILTPMYSDGIWAPKKGTDGQDLPSARLVSASLIPDIDVPHPELTLMLMQWGQFIDHDLDLTPIFTFVNQSGIECCTPSGEFRNGPDVHPQCFPIEIPAGDATYGPSRRRCMNFVRSLPAPRPDCRLGYAEVMNELTHYMDGNQIYGSTLQVATRLRTMQGGKLRSSPNSQGKAFLPLQASGDNCLRETCFEAGDTRVNEQVQLTLMHTIWLREHNRIADELARLNPQWSDEILYQETRRIVIAQLQHITFNEWLPIVLGRSYLRTYGIAPSRNDYFQGYDPSINPNVNIEFATAAFRMGHSMIQGIVRLFTNLHKSDRSFTISSNMNEPTVVRSTGWIDAATRGLLDQESQNFDFSITSEVTSKLFRGGSPLGFDLVSLNIQRGRDHGLPGYNAYREVCGLGRVRNFEQLTDHIDVKMIPALKNVYRQVDDIDLFIGGLAEKPVTGALVGPTFTCIIGDQFARIKKGDRFFYDLGGQSHSFTPDQLAQLRKASLARVICDNNDGSIDSIQPLAFRTARGFNKRVPCNSDAIPRIDLRPWIGERTFG